MSILGEQGVPRYVKHAAAGSGELRNGYPFDAGSAMLLDSNLSRLIHEAPRQLVSTLGPGQVTTFSTLEKTWEDFVDGSEVNANAGQIPWDQRTARRFPCALILDRTGTNGLTTRAIVAEIDCTIDAAATSAYLLFALTLHRSTRALADGNYLARASVLKTGTSGQQRERQVLTVDVPIMTREPWQSRATSTSGGAITYAVPGWIWFGWQFVGGTNYINALSAFETR